MSHGTRPQKKRFQWAPQIWWALVQWPIWPTGESGAVFGEMCYDLCVVTMWINVGAMMYMSG